MYLYFLQCYLCLRCCYLTKVKEIWLENILNNLIVYIESDLPSLYNVRDPTLVFSLIDYNGPVNGRMGNW